MKYTGSCHCQKVQFSVEGELGTVVECNCSHCSRKGYLLWFLPREQLSLHTPDDAMGTYLFNKHVIEHRFCTACGCAPFGFGRDAKGQETVAVNVRCIEGLELGELKRHAYDGRHL
jgi:hypothetical protein